MKTIFLISIFTLSLHHCYSQSYSNFVNEGTNWVYFIDNLYPKLIGYEVGSDTLIENKKYNKFHKNEFVYEPSNLSPPFELINKSLIGVVREDTLLKQVYFILYNNYDSLCNDQLTEFILFNFNLEIGDPLTRSCFYDSLCLAQSQVEGIFEISLFNKIRKSFFLTMVII